MSNEIERLSAWLSGLSCAEIQELHTALFDFYEHNNNLFSRSDDPERLTLLGHYLERAKLIVNSALVQALCSQAQITKGGGNNE